MLIVARRRPRMVKSGLDPHHPHLRFTLQRVATAKRAAGSSHHKTGTIAHSRARAPLAVKAAAARRR